MTNISLAQSYLFKALKRLKILEILLEEDDFSDVIRESQEIVELTLKAMLRQAGIDPPKWHDVGPILLENRELFTGEVNNHIDRLAEISKWLRKERELSFYGDIDFIPSEQYNREDAMKAIADATFTVEIAKKIISI